MPWFGYLLLSFAISLALSFFIVRKTKGTEKNIYWRMGGAAIITSFIVSVFLNPELILTRPLWGLLIGSASVLVFGIVDDKKNLSWKNQLFFQCLLALILILFGFSIDYFAGFSGEMIRLDLLEFSVFGNVISALSVLIILFWVVAVINAINWADGVDGLAGGIGLVGGISLFGISLAREVNQPAIAILAIIFIGSLLGFWWFNFPKAKFLAGTSGSYFIGFFLASLAIMAGTKIATAMIVLAIPLVDLVWVTLERLSQKSPVTKKDFRHLHFKLKQLGWSDRKIVVSYLGFIAVMLAMSQMASERIVKLGIVGVEVAIVVLFLSYLRWSKQITM